VNTAAGTQSPDRHRASLRCCLIVAVILIFVTAPVWAETVTNPYLGITLIKDSVVLPAPADQSSGAGLGVHTANINVVQIDLKAPGLGFKLSPGNGNAPGEALTQTTLQYLTQESAQLAVNAHFFNFTVNAPVNTTLTGFAASNGTVYSEFEPAPLPDALLPYALTANSPGFNISATNQAQIVFAGDMPGTLAGGIIPYNTLSGSDQVITNGVKTLPEVVTTVTGPHQILKKTVPPFSGAPLDNWYTDQIAARTAIGLSQDGTMMYIFTVDAAGGSVGMTVSEEVDYLLSHYSVYNLINLDGGGSTTLAMEDPIAHTRGLVNSVGTQRFVGSSLAIFALPVSEPTSLVLLLVSGMTTAASCVLHRR
jgi:Phosphodiester glycosidase